MFLRNYKNRLEWVCTKSTDVLLLKGNELEELLTSAVADAEPNDFRWMNVEQTALLEVLILRDDRESIGAGILPNVSLGEAAQAALAGMRSIAEKRHKQAWQLGRKVFIKQQLHVGRRRGGGHDPQRMRSRLGYQQR